MCLGVQGVGIEIQGQYIYKRPPGYPGGLLYELQRMYLSNPLEAWQVPVRLLPEYHLSRIR